MKALDIHIQIGLADRDEARSLRTAMADAREAVEELIDSDLPGLVLTYIGDLSKAMTGPPESRTTGQEQVRTALLYWFANRDAGVYPEAEDLLEQVGELLEDGTDELDPKVVADLMASFGWSQAIRARVGPDDEPPRWRWMPEHGAAVGLRADEFATLYA